jgi:hypothetical protein
MIMDISADDGNMMTDITEDEAIKLVHAISSVHSMLDLHLRQFPHLRHYARRVRGEMMGMGVVSPEPVTLPGSVVVPPNAAIEAANRKRVQAGIRKPMAQRVAGAIPHLRELAELHGVNTTLQTGESRADALYRWGRAIRDKLAPPFIAEECHFPGSEAARQALLARIAKGVPR